MSSLLRPEARRGPTRVVMKTAFVQPGVNLKRCAGISGYVCSRVFLKVGFAGDNRTSRAGANHMAPSFAILGILLRLMGLTWLGVASTLRMIDQPQSSLAAFHALAVHLALPQRGHLAFLPWIWVQSQSGRGLYCMVLDLTRSAFLQQCRP